MDDYSRTGPQTPRGDVKAREREMARQMRELYAISDEATLRETLKRDYNVTEEQPRFKQILQLWREQRQHRL